MERGTLQIHYQALLGQIWVNSAIHFWSTFISCTSLPHSTMTQPMCESENTYDVGLLQNAKAHDPEGTFFLNTGPKPPTSI